MKWIDEKTIVITGATSGIGRALTKLFIEKNNCRVIGVGRREEKFKELIAELGEKAGNFEYRLFDVSIESEWQKFAKEMEERAVSVVINNAGVLPKFKTFDKATADITCSEYMRTHEINYNSIVYSTYYMCPVIEKNLNPAIINIASSSGLCPLPGMASYSGSKAAVKNFTEVLALEKKYYVGLVCPGFTKTEIFREQKGEMDSGLIGFIATKLDKMAYKIYKGVIRKRKRMVLGFDAKVMDIGYRWFPKCGPRLFGRVLKSAKIELFDDVFDGNDKRRKK